MNEEKKKILQMVQDGKLTADEAMKVLEELEQSEIHSSKKEKELVTQLSAYVHPGENNNTNTQSHKKIVSAKEKIFGFVDEAVKKLKEIDLDFNFGQSAVVSHIFQHSDAELRDIDIDIVNGSIKVFPWDQKDVRVECAGKVYRLKEHENVRDAFLKEVHFSINDERLRFAVQQKWIKVDARIFIPASEYRRMRLRLFNGNIDGENLSVKDFEAKTANGTVQINGLSGMQAEVETANGTIAVNNAVLGKIESETINGSVSLTGIFKKIDAQALNGSISCNITNRDCDYIHVKGVTGGIELTVPEGVAADGELKSNIGSFNVILDDIHITEEKNEVVQKLLKFKPSGLPEHTLHIFAESKTGGISISRK
ncbi:DUF4097 domain-containing protein [Bacillus sp. M6-12]|uniref:DUF4097 family beta strand repeat-containing protein n=1 Tax=Bacillus sp. M6-12 TaxID=2054166 RepID=UPI000C783B81|nr:DUF4097 domain-containing protein [Bacillus sp. M6-12]PLS17933.1 DUF4097 domain-containing protein [Bacillus sp. M6-12]